MAVELDSDERAKVEAGRLASRPSYFSAALGANTTISDDFEAFLILQNPTVIQSTLNQVSTVTALVTPKPDRNAVLFEALLADQDDRSNLDLELQVNLTAFDVWRTSFQAGKFSETPEVGLIISDLQAVFGELAYQDKRNKHRISMQNLVKDRLRQGVSSNQIREIQSWNTPLLAY